MYSPKIREEHIPALYRLARSRGIPMTMLVDEVLSALLAQPDVQAAVATVAITPKPASGRKHATKPSCRECKAPRRCAAQEQQ